MMSVDFLFVQQVHNYSTFCFSLSFNVINYDQNVSKASKGSFPKIEMFEASENVETLNYYKTNFRQVRAQGQVEMPVVI